MPAETEHITLANRNHDAMMYLIADPDRFPEWVATIGFYKALHIVEAVFRCQGLGDSHDHASRLDRLKRGPCSQLYADFRALYSASIIARYLEGKHEVSGNRQSYKTFTDYIPARDVVAKLVKKRLVRLESVACQYFLDDGCKNLLKKVHGPELPDGT